MRYRICTNGISHWIEFKTGMFKRWVRMNTTFGSHDTAERELKKLAKPAVEYTYYNWRGDKDLNW